MNIRSQVTEYIVDSVTFGDPIADDQSMMNSGMLDSTGAMELIEFLEGTFGINVPDEDLDNDNFDTIGLTVKYVETKLGAQA